MLPRIVQPDNEIGFHWALATGERATLAQLCAQPDAEPDRWLPTHLEALDDVLIAVAGDFGEVLGGARRPTSHEPDGLARAYVAIDRAALEYADAAASASLPTDPRAGQILGTAALMSIRCREPLGLTGSAPFDGGLDQPSPGMVGGRAGLHWVDPEQRWRGARWLVVTDDGLRLPATLSMLLFDSSGVDKDATLTEHREALASVTDAVLAGDAEPLEASGAVDWLLFDWVMAHRESPDSAAVQIPSGRTADAAMILAAYAASVRVRKRYDPAL